MSWCRWLVIAMVLRAGVASADWGADKLDGTFDGRRHEHTVVPGGSEDDVRTLTKGEMTLTRVGPRLWTGTAKAHLKVTIVADTQGVHMVTSGDADVTGTVKLQIDADDAGYMIQWKLSDITGEMKVTTAGVTSAVPEKLRYEGASNVTEAHGKLPAQGTTLDDKWDPGNTPQKERIETWKIKGDELVAVPKVAAVVRAQRAHFDGSASTPQDKIKSWHWTLDPIPGKCSVDPPSREFDGKTADITMLCPMKATLVVSDGTKKSDPKSVDVEITRREWHTKLDAPVPAAAIPGTQLLRGHTLFGKLLCAVAEGVATDASHVIHKKTDKTWRDDAYTIAAPVSDAKSPFDHWLYIQEYKGRYKRQILINADLFASSELWKTNVAAGHGKDIQRIRDCTIEHEKHHDKEMRDVLADGWEPAPRVEESVGRNDSEVEGFANAAISKTENYIAHENFFEWTVHKDLADIPSCKAAAKILVHDGKDYASQDYKSVADIGD